MPSLLNSSRPPVFCPGCAHERVVQALDQALQKMGLAGEQVALVSDIGCSGLFDTFFNTHAMHGLHGRALTYATGIKLARPDLKVIVTMGDGGLGIGGAHVLSTCRRNIDLTLLVLNNFNYGMTGGQCSSTTPPDAVAGSGFLNSLEKPLDVCQVVGSAGAGLVERVSTYEAGLVGKIEAAIAFEGFSVLDIWGVCPGRFAKNNRLSPQSIAADMEKMPPYAGFAAANRRGEYGRAYREAAAAARPAPLPVNVPVSQKAVQQERLEIVLLGSAGQRILTAGELLCLAGASAGLHASQKNDYPITVMRGHSVTEVILDDSEIGYTGIERPTVVVALAQEGVGRRKKLFSVLPPEVLVLRAADVELPPCSAEVVEIDFKALQIKSQDRALAALAWLAAHKRGITKEMLLAAIQLRFKGKALESSTAMVDTFCAASSAS